ncbi:MAG: non-canonical purine NTP pyrophosphatase, partial [Clostridia bacterium]|nr:non-canonical purine NTP pyrophosphatase [Clostridia bacterium]
MEKTVVAATGNAHKLKEIRAILYEWNVMSAQAAGFFGDVEETGETIAENARIKARALCETTGLP